ncbi:hypothetical protein WH27_15265 (plasmid) [Lactiplantibacillus plantarum]|nr:glycosyltransferase [Lactiplantibacillus plantarum]KKX43458.1 hypothetical protein WH27_15265 [Lactiplantibacillus plantarum]
MLNRVTFVILHYMAESATAECINSLIKNLAYPNFQMVVVDNGSSNRSFAHLKESYEDQSNLTFIDNDENLGFAQGNNLGYQYAKIKLKSDFIVMLNNDTEITQSDFCDIALNIYRERQYAVLGPDIITLDGAHQNPMPQKSWSSFRLRVFQFKTWLRFVDSKFLDLGPIIEKQINMHRLSLQSQRQVDEMDGARLHGACWIFSPKYVERFEGINPNTFLYMEEDLLKMAMDRFGLKMIYSNKLRILHKENVSTNFGKMSTRSQNQQFLRRLLSSINVCISYFNTEGKNS